MGRLLVRYRDTDAIRWGELEGSAPRQPNEAVSVLPLAFDCSFGPISSSVGEAMILVCDRSNDLRFNWRRL